MDDLQTRLARIRKGTVRPTTPALRISGAVAIFWLSATLFLQSWRYGLLVTISFALHELGHILALHHYHIPWEVRLSLMGVATVTPRAERQRLSHFANAQIHLAGPAMNLVQALIALAGYLLSGSHAGDRPESWLLVANLAALLVLLNLLPLGDLSDGGKFIRRLFACLSEGAEESIVWSLFLWLLSVVWLIIVNWGDIFRTLGSLVVAAWFVIATLWERHYDDPQDACERQSMTRRQGILLFSLVATALLWATGISVLTPFWITLEHLETMAFNIALVLVLAQRAGPLVTASGFLILGATLILVLTQRQRPS